MKQKTNKNNKQNLRPVPEAEMRQNVLKSGLCNEVIAGVLTDQGEIPNIGGQTSNVAVGGEMPQAEMQSVPTDEEMQAYIEQCRGKRAEGEFSIESLVCMVYDLASQNNALVELIGKIQSGEAVYIGGENQNTQGQMQNPQPQMQGQPQMQPQMQMQGGLQSGESAQNIPRSTGGTGGYAQKQAYIPKSQVEKMTREEIREMFDVIDRSRKEW